MADKNHDAEKVEESLRDFIGRVGNIYKDHNLLREVSIARRDTGQVREEDFGSRDSAGSVRHHEGYVRRTHGGSRQAYEQVAWRYSRDDLLSDSSDNQKQNLEKILQNYEKEINTHTKVEQSMQDLINDFKGKVHSLEKELDFAKSRVTVGVVNEQKLENELSLVANQNKTLESTNGQLKALLNNTPVGIALRPKSRASAKRGTRKSNSTDRARADLLIDVNNTEFKTMTVCGKRGKPKFRPSNTQSKDMLMTFSEVDSVTASYSEKKNRRGA